MSKRKQRLQSIYNVGYKIGESIWKDHGSIDKPEFRKLFRKRYSGYRRNQPLAHRAAKNGYVNSLTKAKLKADAEELTTNATTEEPKDAII